MKRIPTIIGLVLVVALVAGLALTTTLMKQNASFFSKASVTQALILPVATANVTDTSFTLYWISATAGPGTVVYGKTAAVSDGTAVDNTNSAVHFLQVTSLQAGTKYYYRLGSADSSSVGEVTTLASPSAVVADPIFGKAVPEALVVWQGLGTDSGKLVALTKSDGSYVLPVVGVTPGQKETVSVYTAEGNATITCLSGQDKPLPTVAIGDNVDCITATSSGTVPFGFSVPPSLTSSVGGQLEVNLQEKEIVSSPLPTISGKAGPNQVVKIEIHSAEIYTGTVKADGAGNWSWTPPANLTPGSHTATITITNPDGTTQTVTRTFLVAASSSILPITSGTPSAVTTYQACVNQACTKIEGAGTNTCLTDADCAPMPVATPAPVTPPVVTPSTGALENTLFLIAGGLILITVGFGLIL